jgi:hypothetical protein
MTTDAPITPHHWDAERALVHRVADRLRPEHVYEGVHPRMDAAILHYVDHGMVPSPLTRKPVCDQDPALQALQGDSCWRMMSTLWSNTLYTGTV